MGDGAEHGYPGARFLPHSGCPKLLSIGCHSRVSRHLERSLARLARDFHLRRGAAKSAGRLQAARRTIAEIAGTGAPLLGGFLADSFSPAVPFLAYAPLLVFSAVLLAVVGRETLQR